MLKIIYSEQIDIYFKAYENNKYSEKYMTTWYIFICL